MEGRKGVELDPTWMEPWLARLLGLRDRVVNLSPSIGDEDLWEGDRDRVKLGRWGWCWPLLDARRRVPGRKGAGVGKDGVERRGRDRRG